MTAGLDHYSRPHYCHPDYRRPRTLGFGGLAYAWAGAALLLTSTLLQPCLASEILVVRSTVQSAPAAPACHARRVALGHGGTLGGALSKLQVSQTQVLDFNRRLPSGYRARELRASDHVIACLGASLAHHRELVGLEIVRHHGRRAVIGHFPTHIKARPTVATNFKPPSAATLSNSLRHVYFELNGSMSAALSSQHVSPLETDAINAWLKSDADLPAKIPPGTRVGLLLGRTSADPSERLLRMRIWYQGNVHALYDYVDSDGRRWTLNRGGLGILHLHLLPPVDYTRISSGWGWRDQPVLHVPEFHKGIDFAAPMGTAVHAAACGIVKFSGWHGNYGRLVIVQHTANTQTRYAHLSRMASGIHAGSRVSAGQVIGYVGSSGLSTGPHLYYELFMHDLRVNPLTTVVNLPVRLTGPVLHAFRHYVSRIDNLRPALADAG